MLAASNSQQVKLSLLGLKMHSTWFCTLSIFISVVFAVPTTDQSQNRQPKCSTDTYNLPCVCPKGTTFRNLTTFGVIGAPALEVQGVMANCKYPSFLCNCKFTWKREANSKYSFRLRLARSSSSNQDNRRRGPTRSDTDL